MRIDGAFVDKWAAKYGDEEDARLPEVGRKLREMGCYNKATLEEVGQWKSPRSRSYLERNSEADVKAISTAAFNAPFAVQHRLIQALHGVGSAMASALLMAWDPNTHTVIDVRAIEALREAGLWADKKHWPGYIEYVGMCQRLATDAECDLRTLDRALWAWSKHH